MDRTGRQSTESTFPTMLRNQNLPVVVVVWITLFDISKSVLINLVNRHLLVFSFASYNNSLCLYSRKL